MKDSLVRIAEYVVDHGLLGEGPYRAARDLLLRAGPRLGGQPLHRDGENAVEAAVRVCGHLSGGILAIQGPPGAGKTTTGARMICELVRQGKTVGVTANSHKVIRHLLDSVIKAADEYGVNLLRTAAAPALIRETQRRPHRRAGKWRKRRRWNRLAMVAPRCLRDR
jgi:uncharacterized protein